MSRNRLCCPFSKEFLLELERTDPNLLEYNCRCFIYFYFLPGSKSAAAPVSQYKVLTRELCALKKELPNMLHGKEVIRHWIFPYYDPALVLSSPYIKYTSASPSYLQGLWEIWAAWGEACENARWWSITFDLRDPSSSSILHAWAFLAFFLHDLEICETGCGENER